MTETVSDATRGSGRKRGKGLPIRRIHTTPGVHPYDEVTWERRDVVMTNWRDGSVNFEQRGVEFPDFWSVNATNIVTSKYLRGAVGTPQREWSLKQLIDRVVKKYRAAGEEHDYFATSGDADVFEHELTWALLHQVFSFNSPVWFNVGTSSPQQVSACQPYDALVSTPAGLVPIGRLVDDNAVGMKVFDAHGLTQVMATKANGVKPVLRLQTEAGYALDVTADHLVWRSTGEGMGRFVPAGELRPGDHLEWHLRAADGEADIDPTATAEPAPADGLQLGDFVGQHPAKRLEIARIEHLGPMEVYDIQTDSGEYLSAGLRVHNCFILSVEDTMESILNWYREEGLIFKGGSGAGLNLSRIRSSRELLSSGGTASGPVSFMRGADASAGTIKSGGATRRAAKMVVLDVDHPDIEEFIQTKAREEDKIRVLRDAGFDMDLGGRDIASVQYQNANNSVRVSDEFMRAVGSSERFALRARTTGEVLEEVDAKTLFRKIAQAAWDCADPGIQYDDTINDWHTNPETGRITASNPCSEYLSLDNSSCNLASLNLMKFLRDDDTFDIEAFVQTVELVITAMDISICFADFPTESIGETTRAYRQLGIGYANLGALLMATGHGYDSDGGRALAAAITSLMTGTAYKRSAELAGVVGPYDGYARNADAHKRVMRKHAAANDTIRSVDPTDKKILRQATKAWQECLAVGEKHGWRNAQASVLAPTGCLTGDTLVTTERGLSRLSELGDIYGDRWQDLGVRVATDEGSRIATKFFVNGEEPCRRVVTDGGYRIQGTLTHRVKVVDPNSGHWVWKRLADVEAGDVVPLQLGVLVGDPRQVPLPALDQASHTADGKLHIPETVTAELAELVGYYLGAGSLQALTGIRLRVADADLDVVQHLRVLAKECFGIEALVRQCNGYHEVTLQSARLARWWQRAGFGKPGASNGHVGSARTPGVPSVLLEANDQEIYAAFVRGLFEANGAVVAGVPGVSTAAESFASEIRTLLLTLGFPTTTAETTSGRSGRLFEVRLRNADYAVAFEKEVGFISGRKAKLVAQMSGQHPGERDRFHGYEPVRKPLAGSRPPASRPAALSSVDAQNPSAPPSSALPDRARMGRSLIDHGSPNRLYLFETVAANEDAGIQPTYDLSVPDNVTYVAAGFVSHNTIGLMMDCDTTGIEPDLALVKFKKLVGGGSMQIVNQTVPLALHRLGYQQEQVEAIVDYISEHGHVVDAPGLRQEHYEVFDCAMGQRAIRPMGHVQMMAAVQPFISGAISKTVNMPESATVEEIEQIYFEGWKLGLKALAIYRDNCKVGQPLSNAKAKKAAADNAEPERIVEYRPVRKRLPKSRPSKTVSYTVGGAEGYMTASSYPDDGLGEVFLKMSKQGSTLAGVMDAFSIAISIGLQYGVPLETFVSKFVNMRFEPSGLTDDPDIRMAQSVVDYIFRRLALDYLPHDTRAAMSIFTAAERARQLDSGAAGHAEEELDVEALRQSAPLESRASRSLSAEMTEEGANPAPPQAHSSTELLEAQLGKTADAPLCFTCGTKMRPAGSCYVCEGCGSTSGCS